jgi:hypothetical protein
MESLSAPQALFKKLLEFSCSLLDHLKDWIHKDICLNMRRLVQVIDEINEELTSGFTSTPTLQLLCHNESKRMLVVISLVKITLDKFGMKFDSSSEE